MIASMTSTRCRWFTRRSLAALLPASLLVWGCASAPAPPVVVSYEEKLASILRLEDHRVLRDPAPAPVVQPAPTSGSGVMPPPPPPPNLISMLRDDDARIRRRAALAVGRVGMKEGTGPLTGLLSDPIVDVRQMAAFGLGLLKDPSAETALRGALADPSPSVQGRAAEALGFIGAEGSAGEIGRMVARHMSEAATLAPDHESPLEPGANAVRLGVGALVRLKAYDALAGAVLNASGQPLTEWWPVAFALERIGEPRAAPALLTLARSKGLYTRGFAVKGLGTLKERQAVPLLVQMLEAVDREPSLVAEAARALGKIADPQSRPALARLSTNFKVSPMIRAEAVTALGEIPETETLNALLNVLADRSPTVRAAALTALSKRDPETLLRALSSLDADPHWSVRAALAGALTALDPTIAVPRLREMLADTDQRVVPAVLTALTRLRAEGVEQILLERLKAEDPIVRAVAATQLGEQMPASAVPALIAAYRFGEVDSTYTARAAALSALAKSKEASAWETIASGLADKDWALRLRAAELLRQRDPNADVAAMRPAPVSLTAADYQSPSLVAPQFSPHVYIETVKGTIQIELAVLDAPLTARNFIALARRGWFKDLAIHRVVPNFVVQDGDPRGDGEGSPGYTIRDELNDRPYLRGTVGMALDWADTGGSQFFITHSPQPHLDARYTVFGHVVAGMEVVDRLDQWDVIRRVTVWDGVEFSGIEGRDPVRAAK
jgi:cyclophilin family peptidyl-prolyl cis-trans isomerase/HEAT repeat protein